MKNKMHATCSSVFFLAGFCDFEMDMCGWVNSQPAGSGVDWDWRSGDSEGKFIPRRDHTTGSSLGKPPHTLTTSTVISSVFCISQNGEHNRDPVLETKEGQ